MYASYGPTARSRAQLLNLYEPMFEHKADLYLGYDGRIIISTDQGLEWRAARFDLVPN